MSGLMEMARTRRRQNNEVLNSGWQVPAWGAQSACRTEDPETLFPENGRPKGDVLKKNCGACPVREECLEFALAGPWLPYGPWGGLTQTQVQKLWTERHPTARGDDDTVLKALGLA